MREGWKEGEGGARSCAHALVRLRATCRAAAAGERRRAFFTRSACIGSPPCSCGGVAGAWWARLRRRRIGDAGVGGGSVASVGADGFAPGRPGRRPGAAAVAATNRSLRHPLRLSLL